ncbi:TerD family protein [Pseudonocardia nigra]|uniref:TerD family protein n=1 Tax=Pseudonocardia nigra TaxID=1921578 RepID=UPI001C60132A|nr:TerD family protein [Pseudonocardia nigra]
MPNHKLGTLADYWGVRRQRAHDAEDDTQVLSRGTDVDVVAFLVDADERVIADEDFVFYNAPVSEHGTVALSVDGDSEQSVRVDLALVSEHHSKIIIAAAVDGDATFGDLGAVTLSVDGDTATSATSTFDAATTERTMLLAELATRHGVTVDSP